LHDKIFVAKHFKDLMFSKIGQTTDSFFHFQFNIIMDDTQIIYHHFFLKE